MKTVFIKVYGKVQGVFFRQTTIAKAKELSLTGYALNARDGTVEIMAQGMPENIDQLIAWCHHGPERARVNKVDVQVVGEKISFRSFELRYP